MSKSKVSYKFKRALYTGKVYLVDTVSKEVIVTGYGSFDTEKLALQVQIYSSITPSSHDSVLIVLETIDGFFAPLSFHDFHSMGIGGHLYNESMDTCLHWPISKGADYVFEQFSTLSITINAGTEEESLALQSGEDQQATFSKVARVKSLGDLSLSPYYVEVKTGYSCSSTPINVRGGMPLSLDGTIRFKIEDTRGGNFNITSFNSALFAFKSYWLLAHSNTDCGIRSVTMGAVNFIFTKSTLQSPQANTASFRAFITPNVDLKLDTLLKLFYFILNPDGKRKLSKSSKVGLSLSSLVRYSYDDKPQLLDYEAIGLIAGFQGLVEFVAGEKIKSANGATKRENLNGIDMVLEAIDSIKDDLPIGVRDFYLKDRSNVYAALSRPSFKRSVETALGTLGIDATEYESTIDITTEARQQIVHHEDYDGSFLMNLIATGKTDIKRNDSGEIVQMAFGLRVGELDRLFELTLDMARRYFDSFRITW